MNRKIFQIASAYMSVIIGGGFASGQEVLQFFTNFGWMGVAGTVISGVLFAFWACRLPASAPSSKWIRTKKCCRLFLANNSSLLVDLALIFFLFGVGVAMLAGSGSLFQEHLGLPSVVGAVAMTVVIAATLCLNLHRIVDLISAVTPFLIVMVVIVVSYALLNNSGADTAALEAVAVQGEKAAGNWALSGLLYASFNIAVGFPLLAVLAGSDTNLRNTTWGGIHGGLGLGALIFLLNIGLFFNIDQIRECANAHRALGQRRGLLDWRADDDFCVLHDLQHRRGHVLCIYRPVCHAQHQEVPPDWAGLVPGGAAAELCRLYQAGRHRVPPARVFGLGADCGSAGVLAAQPWQAVCRRLKNPSLRGAVPPPASKGYSDSNNKTAIAPLNICSARGDCSQRPITLPNSVHTLMQG